MGITFYIINDSDSVSGWITSGIQHGDDGPSSSFFKEVITSIKEWHAMKFHGKNSSIEGM